MRSEVNERELLVVPRFKVLGFLCQVEEADYPALVEFTELSIPDISRSVGFLADRGLVQVRKERTGRVAHTIIRATPDGIREFRALLEGLRKYGLS